MFNVVPRPWIVQEAEFLSLFTTYALEAMALGQSPMDADQFASFTNALLYE